MSTRLPLIDLTSASVGSSDTVKLPYPAVQVDEVAHLRLYNESGCGLNIAFDNGHTETVPAGAWPMFEIEPVVRQFTYTVYYVLPNAPVALVTGVYYYPYEGVPPTPALGNSPIGVTGGVQTSSVQTLSNENSILGTKIVDIGSLTIADLFDIFNDHFVFKVQQGGVAHQVLAGNTAGNPLSIGQAGDISEVLGSLTVDQAEIITGALTATNTGNNILLGTGINIQGAGIGFAGSGDTIGITTAGGNRQDPHIKAGATPGSGSIGWLESEGTQVASWDINSALRCRNSKSIVFNFGSIGSVGIKAFTGLGTGTAIVLTHNFGFVPDAAFWSGGQAANVNPGTTTASVYNWLANTCLLNNFASVNGVLLYIKA